MRKIWEGMMARCYNPRHKSYANYGGRGISVCTRWHDYQTFVDDMAPRPKGRQLDRRNNNEGYSKDNCRWATLVEQRANRRTARNEVTIDGVPRAQIARHLGVSSSAIRKRIERNGHTGRVNKPAEFEGRHLREWSRELGIAYETLRLRLRRNGSIWL